jgi:hypothetical protein
MAMPQIFTTSVFAAIATLCERQTRSIVKSSYAAIFDQVGENEVL